MHQESSFSYLRLFINAGWPLSDHERVFAIDTKSFDFELNQSHKFHFKLFP